MQVVFTQNVKGIARKGEVKNVKDGYFQNFLFPRKLAVIATDAKVREAETMRKHETITKDRVKEQAHELQKKLTGLKITIKSKANGDKLYGSISEKDIVDAIEKDAKVQLGKSNVVLSDHIKVVGTYEIPIALTEGVEAKITLVVKGEKK